MKLESPSSPAPLQSPIPRSGSIPGAFLFIHRYFASLILGPVLCFVFSGLSPLRGEDDGSEAAVAAFNELMKKATAGDVIGASKLTIDPSHPGGSEVFAQSIVDLVKDGAVKLEVLEAKAKGDYSILVVLSTRKGNTLKAYQPVVMRRTKGVWQMLASADGKARSAFQFKNDELEAMALLGKWATGVIDSKNFEKVRPIFEKAIAIAKKRVAGKSAGKEPKITFDSFNHILSVNRVTVLNDLEIALSWFQGIDVLPAGTKNSLIKMIHGLATTLSTGQVKLHYLDSKSDANCAVVLSELKGPLKPGVRDKGSYYPYMMLKRDGEWRFLAARQISAEEAEIYKLSKKEFTALEALGEWTQKQLANLALGKIEEQFAQAAKRAENRAQLRGNSPASPEETMNGFFKALTEGNITVAHSWLAQSKEFDGQTREYILDFLYELSGQLATGATTITPVLAPSSDRCALMLVRAQGKDERGGAVAKTLPAYDEFLPMIKQEGEWRVIHDASLNAATSKAYGLTRVERAAFSKLRREMHREINKLCLNDLAPISGASLKRGQEIAAFAKSTPEECFLDLVNAGRKNDYPRMLLWLAEADCISHYDRMNFLSEFQKFSADVPLTVKAGREIIANRDGNVALLAVNMESLVQGILIWKTPEGWRVLPHPDYRDKARARHRLSGEFKKSYGFGEADLKSFEAVGKWLDDALTPKEDKKLPAKEKASPEETVPKARKVK